jgi:hypothetical protein
MGISIIWEKAGTAAITVNNKANIIFFIRFSFGKM